MGGARVITWHFMEIKKFLSRSGEVIEVLFFKTLNNVEVLKEKKKPLATPL
jgi:hypothetical protein